MLVLKDLFTSYCSEWLPNVQQDTVKKWIENAPFLKTFLERYEADTFATFTTLATDGKVLYAHGWQHCSGAFVAWLDYKIYNTSVAGKIIQRPGQPRIEEFAVKADLERADYAVIPLPIATVAANYNTDNFVTAEQLVIQWAEFCTSVGYTIMYGGVGMVKQTYLRPLKADKDLPCFLMLLSRNDFVKGSHAVGAMQLARFIYFSKFAAVASTALALVTKTNASPQEALYYAGQILKVNELRINSFAGSYASAICFPYPESKEEVRELFANNVYVTNSSMWGPQSLADCAYVPIKCGGYGQLHNKSELTFMREFAYKIFLENPRSDAMAAAVAALDITTARKLYVEEIAYFKDFLSTEDLFNSQFKQVVNENSVRFALSAWMKDKIIKTTDHKHVIDETKD